MKFWKKNQLSDEQADELAVIDRRPSGSEENPEFENTIVPAVSGGLLPGSSQSEQANVNDDAFSDTFESVQEEADIDTDPDTDSEEEVEALEYEFQRIKSEIHQQVIGRIDLTALGG
ncbi:MAG: hypothetical protein ACPGPS_19580, partial [Rubripirellula sp.]